MKALVGAFNQEKALVGAFSVIVQTVVEPMDRFKALHSVDMQPRPGSHQQRIMSNWFRFKHFLVNFLIINVTVTQQEARPDHFKQQNFAVFRNI